MIRKWTPESDEPKPGEASNVQQLRAWFERLPKMRELICQQQEHIASLRNAATTTTSGTSGAPGRSGTSDKVGRNSDAAMDAEQHLAELKCQYAEMQKDAIEVAYMLHADPASIKRSRCLILYYVEGKSRQTLRRWSAIPALKKSPTRFLPVCISLPRS